MKPLALAITALGLTYFAFEYESLLCIIGALIAFNALCD